MINFCSLYSGSSGNSLFLRADDTKILIDAGMSLKKITEGLCSINISIEELDAILITHEHIDHVRGLNAICKKYDIPIYANHKTWSALPIDKQYITKTNKKVFITNQKFRINDIEVLPFNIPHDAIDPCGFNIFNNNSKISIATDLGYVDDTIITYLKNSSFIMLESNYDPNILQYSSYPYKLKQRIVGPNGHLSNSNAGNAICSLIPSGLKSVILGHLSKENNFPELAIETICEELVKNNFETKCIDLCVANRYEPSKMISIQ